MAILTNPGPCPVLVRGFRRALRASDAPGPRRVASAKPRLAPFALAAALLALGPIPSMAARLKDIAAIEGVRGNQLSGYGIVAGLNGTGDTQQALFTVQ